MFDHAADPETMVPGSVCTVCMRPDKPAGPCLPLNPIGIATEHLVSATWGLFWVGVPTLAAAALAAYFAWRAYRLEAQPTLVMTRSVDRPRMQGHIMNPSLILARDPDPIMVPKPGDPSPAAVLRPLRASDAERFPKGVLGDDQAFFEVRNVGRSPIVDARIVAVLRVAEFDRCEPMGVIDVDYPVEIRIPSITANESIFIPIIQSLAAGATLEVRGVTKALPDVEPASSTDAKRRRVVFVAEPLSFYPYHP
jgi:hypothetical protein